MSDSPEFLIVEDDIVVANTLQRWFAQHAPVRLVSTVERALEAIDGKGSFVGVVLDIKLPDGSGLEVLAHLRHQGYTVPAMMLTAHIDRTQINRAHALRAQYVCKPPEIRNLRAFARQALARSGPDDEGLRRAIHEVALAYRLSELETRIVALAASGVERRAMSKELLVTENTVKTTIRRLLKKTPDANLDAVVRRVLTRALGLP